MMKNTFNAMLKNRPKGQKVNEIYLFRLMARYLNQTAIKCIRKLHLDKPAAIIELKWNKNASGAIAQIKRQQYSEVLKDYHGDLLLAGINYDKKTKLHECVIEKFQKY